MVGQMTGAKRNQVNKALSKMYPNTYIIFVNISNRYDLDENSVINQEIRLFNKKLNKIPKVFQHVVVLENDLHRMYYTRHGMHVNKRGKEQLSKQITSLINKLEIQRAIEKPIIALRWKTHLTQSQTQKQSPKKQRPESIPDNSCQPPKSGNEDTVNRISTRQRKIPITRKDDFLWKM
jgi:hypothetical protein